MRLTPKLARACILMVAFGTVLGAAPARAATPLQKVTEQSAVTTLNTGSAAEQAFILAVLRRAET